MLLTGVLEIVQTLYDNVMQGSDRLPGPRRVERAALFGLMLHVTLTLSPGRLALALPTNVMRTLGLIARSGSAEIVTYGRKGKELTLTTTVALADRPSGGDVVTVRVNVYAMGGVAPLSRERESCEEKPLAIGTPFTSRQSEFKAGPAHDQMYASVPPELSSGSLLELPSNVEELPALIRPVAPTIAAMSGDLCTANSSVAGDEHPSAKLGSLA